MAKIQIIASEHEEQCAVVQYLEIRGLKFTSIPNSTYTKSPKQKAKNYEEGLRRGLPDMLIVMPKCLLFIEMKRTKGGVTSPHQKEWIEALNVIDNVVAVVCKGADQAIAVIDRHNKFIRK